MVPKMILRLGFVDLADHIASSISTPLVALSELSEPSLRARPVFSYIPLSQCQLQVVCCRERLHVTAFGKIADLSRKQAPKCTKILHVGSSFHVFLCGMILGLPDRMEFHPSHIRPPSGSL